MRGKPYDSAARRRAWSRIQRQWLAVEQRDFSEIWIERNPPATAGAATTRQAAPTLADASRPGGTGKPRHKG